MWTVSNITDLPFQVENVAAHFGLPPDITVGELRAHAISPGGRFCAGTTTITPPESSVNFPRGYILRNIKRPRAIPSWEILPDFPIPSNWRGYSIRGINDHGDISGFYFDLADPFPPSPLIPRPFVKLAGDAPVEIKFPPLPLNTPGQIWAISNNRRISGDYRDAGDILRGFTAKLRKDGSIKPSQFTEFPVTTVKSFNRKKDLLYLQDGTQVFEFGRGPLAGRAINISEHSIFGGANVMMNGISNSRRVAGFFGPPPNRQGFLGHLYGKTGVLDPFVFSHPLLADTRLFSISDNGVVVGVIGANKPFFMIVKKT